MNISFQIVENDFVDGIITTNKLNSSSLSNFIAEKIGAASSTFNVGDMVLGGRINSSGNGFFDTNTFNSTYSGSSFMLGGLRVGPYLSFANAHDMMGTRSGGALAGTWRLLSAIGTHSSGSHVYYHICLLYRIA